jgi:4'-phosphopantetheinyl transferase EntD
VRLKQDSGGRYSSSAVITSLLPATVACAEAFGDVHPSSVATVEAVVVAPAVVERRREFATVRHCARAAMHHLGLPAAPILPDLDGVPQWPLGVVGSMTHCPGYRAAAVARATDLRSVGIDAEPHAPLPDDVLDLVIRADERDALSALAAAAGDLCWDRIAYCVKEAAYKAWFPTTREWLDFTDVRVQLRVDGTFVARAAASGQRARDVAAGRWTVGRGLVVTAAWDAAHE